MAEVHERTFWIIFHPQPSLLTVDLGAVDQLLQCHVAIPLGRLSPSLMRQTTGILKSLKYEIAKLNADLATIPSEVKEIFRRFIGDLSAIDLIKKSIQVRG